MLNRFIDLHVDRPWIVIFWLVLLVAAGAHSLSQIPIDAFPDLTSNQVVIVTEAPGLAAVEVEQLVTFPIESMMMGLPDTQEVRSLSKFGLSMVTVVFDDGVDTYFARQVVNERLAEARGRIPQGLAPTLGPVATAFGEVYQYTVEGEGYSPMELKTLHDWEIKYQLRAIRGVADVNTWGGLSRRYEIVADPVRLRSYGLSLRDVFERVRDNNANFGAGFVEHVSEQYTVRGLGLATTAREMGAIVLTSHHGAPVYLRDVAKVKTGSVPRQGAVTSNGEGERVSGMVIMLKGQNSNTVIRRVKELLERLPATLPEGVRIVPFYDQSEVIEGSIRTVRDNLLKGGALVAAVLFLFLGNWRAALLVAFVIPLSMLAAFIGMRVFGITANLMSLGAVDFGMIIDGAVVMTENQIRRLRMLRAEAGGEISSGRLREEVRQAAHEVARPVLFGVSIITAVYIPILTLEGLEGRLYRPMAVTVVCALLGAMFLSLAVLPAAARFLMRGELRAPREPLMNRLRAFYVSLLERILDHKTPVLAVASLVITGAVGSLAFIGTEFMPRLDEGSMLVQTFKLPSISLSESVDAGLEAERTLLEFPEVTAVVSKTGRPDFATEAMGIYEADVYVRLKPREEWTTASTRDGLADAMAAKLEKIPGVGFNFTQPMAMRLDETLSGLRADVAVKIFGEDEQTLNRLGDEVVRLIRRVEGAADVQKQVFSGAAEWQVKIHRGKLARWGLNVTDVEDAVQAAIAGKTVSESIEGRRRFPIVVRLPEEYRQSRKKLASLWIAAPGGAQVPLADVADVVRASGPEVIHREDAQRRLAVQANVRGRDLGGFVGEAQELIEANVKLPQGYFIRWGGQFENQERAMRRLALVVPGVLLLIFFFLYSAFRSAAQSVLVLMIVPFATIGGIGALWLRDMNLNVSASIGFIAVFGVAILDGIVLVTAINRLLEEGRPMRQALVEAAGMRLRPVVITSVVAALGFLPMAVATTTGAEVQRPLATVVIGGLMTSTVLTLLLLPTLFPWFSRGKAEQAHAQQ